MKTPVWFIPAPRLVGASLALLGMSLLALPQGLRAQQCDESLLGRTNQDPAFYFGEGDQTSANRSVARSMATAQARGALALAAQLDITAMTNLVLLNSVTGNVEELRADFTEATRQVADVQLTNVITEATSYCRDGERWAVVVLLKVDQGNLAEEALLEVREEIEEAIASGDAEYTRALADAALDSMDQEVAARRERGGGLGEV